MTTMQVVWVYPECDGVGGVLELPLKRVERMTLLDVASLLRKELLLDSTKDVKLKMYGTNRMKGMLKHYLPALRVPCPRFVLTVLPCTGNVSVFVKPPNRRLMTLSVDLDDTALQLKNLIEYRIGIPIEEQRLLVGSNELLDKWTLYECGVRDCSTIHIVARLVGGAVSRAPIQPPGANTVSFVDVSNISLVVQKPFARTAPKWRIVNPGLNFQGMCTSATCEASQQFVTVPMKFQAVNVKTTVAMCPMCSKRVTPTTCVFYNCRWRFEGEKVDGSGLHMSSDWHMADGDGYYEFAESKNNMVVWKTLVITAQRLNIVEECNICFEDLRGVLNATLPCNHRVHPACMFAWRAACSSRNQCVTCPLCRVPCPNRP